MSLMRLSFILTVLISLTTCEKISLTFVIDDTLSMGDDIDAVKKGADKIMNIVLDKRSSQIENLILVTVNDPPVTTVNINTKDQIAFRHALHSLRTHNIRNFDCAEPSLHGVELALETSLPGSEIYVFTDASAKDYDMLNTITNLCQKKQSRIIFVLTGTCGLNAETNETVKVFYQIAAACSGEVFNVHKDEIYRLFPYFQDNNKGSKTILTSKTVPPNVWSSIDFMVDDKAEYVLISTSGKNVQLKLNGPNDSVRNAQKTTWLQNVKVLKLVNPKPGAYQIKVRSSAYASVIAFARTDFTFLHGFSEVVPKSLKDTTAQPIKGTSSHLSVLVTDTGSGVNVKDVQILEMKEKIIKQIPLKKMSGGFYTTDSQLWPTKRFKVAITAISKSGQTIRRIANTPIEPQKPKEPDSKSPVVSIGEGTATTVTYNDHLTLTCRVSAYPLPNIVWKDSNGNKLPAKSFTLEPPYEYRSILDLQHVKTPNKYSCYAENNKGRSDVKTVAVTVDSPFIVNDDHIRGVTKIKYGHKGILKCNIKSKLPMRITWKMYNQTLKIWNILKSGPKYTIPEDSTQLKINSMDLDAEGQYACEATLKNDGYKGPTFRTEVKITGISKPKLEKVSSVIKTMVNDSVVISCRITAGIPKPEIQLQFKRMNSKTFVDRKLVNGEIRIKAALSDTGIYRCTAENQIGFDEQRHVLIVQSKPIITPEKSEFYAVENDSVLRLPCEAIGYPKPTLTWKINGTIITPDTKYKISSNGHLIINKPVRKDRGVYTCTAKNEFGTAENKYTVEVEEYLDADINYGNTSDVFELIDKPLKLECSLPIASNDKVRWYLNGLDMNITNRFIYFSTPSASDDGNYTCRVSNEKGSVSETYNLEFGYAPKFKTEDDNSVIQVNWNGDDEELSCEVDAKPNADAVWLYNGKKVGDSSLHLTIAGWGSYSCKVTNVHGSVQRNFNVTSKGCIIEKKKKLEKFPLIITDKSSWLDFDEGPKTLKIKQGQRLQMSCRSNSKNVNNLKTFKKSDIIAVCDREDKFLIEGKPYKFSDLQCDDEVFPIINKTGLICKEENSEKVSVGFNVPGLIDVYEVCIDKARNIPLYTKSLSSSSNQRDNLRTTDWYNVKNMNNNAFDKTYNCSKTEHGRSSCCYDKKQLVNADKVTYGPAQRATFINQLNAIPVWIPCNENTENNTWSLIDHIISDNIGPAHVWSGVDKVENINGNLVPRYLWKVIKSNEEYSSIIHVNSPAPTDKDILCENVCEDVEWVKNKKTTYCCDMEEFLKVFKFRPSLFAVADDEIEPDVIDTLS